MHKVKACLALGSAMITLLIIAGALHGEFFVELDIGLICLLAIIHAVEIGFRHTIGMILLVPTGLIFGMFAILSPRTLFSLPGAFAATIIVASVMLLWNRRTA